MKNGYDIWMKMNHLASDDRNFSWASRAAFASSSSYRLQLYHDEPWGSHDPKQTQQKSCLQFWFLHTCLSNDTPLWIQSKVDKVAFMCFIYLPCDCIRRPSQWSHYISGILLYWPQSSSMFPNRRHIFWSIFWGICIKRDHASFRHTQSKICGHICKQPVEIPHKPLSQHTNNRLMDTNATNDCTVNA